MICTGAQWLVRPGTLCVLQRFCGCPIPPHSRGGGAARGQGSCMHAFSEDHVAGDTPPQAGWGRPGLCGHVPRRVGGTG